jgi:hypothetical protein
VENPPISEAQTGENEEAAVGVYVVEKMKWII